MRCEALSALVNLTCDSDANRNLFIEVGGVAPVVESALNAEDSFVVEQAVRCLCNVSYNNPYTASKVLNTHGCEAIAAAFEVSDITRHHEVVEACMVAFANMSNNEMNQTHVGASQAPKCAMQACQHAPHPDVKRAAANAVSAMAYKSPMNKGRLVGLGAIATLLGVAERHGFGPTMRTKPYAGAVEAACACLASLITYKPNRLPFVEGNGIGLMVRLCNEAEDMRVLTAASMALASMAPTPEERSDAAAEGRTIPMEGAGAADALVRCQQWVFGRAAPPQWLTEAIEILSMDDQALGDEKRRLHGQDHAAPEPKEYLPRVALFREVATDIFPDHETTRSDGEISKLLFKIY